MSEEELPPVDPENEEGNAPEGEGAGEALERVIQVAGMYNNYFLDYASYVILERAVPHQDDGLKPVQRRILHSLDEMDDGRFHKVANVIGNTMKYHPHGDASIGDAMVQIGQKDLLLDCQGNWETSSPGTARPLRVTSRCGSANSEKRSSSTRRRRRGCRAMTAATRSRRRCPSSSRCSSPPGWKGLPWAWRAKQLPHNFVELIDASVATLQGKGFTLYPDFPTGGTADVESTTMDCAAGKVRVRGRIEKADNKTLVIRELPFGVTTSSLIESILKANDKGKIKIKRVEDNTASEVEIVIHLANNVSPDKMIGALFAFTDCEVSIYPTPPSFSMTSRNSSGSRSCSRFRPNERKDCSSWSWRLNWVSCKRSGTSRPWRKSY